MLMRYMSLNVILHWLGKDETENTYHGRWRGNNIVEKEAANGDVVPRIGIIRPSSIHINIGYHL